MDSKVSQMIKTLRYVLLLLWMGAVAIHTAGAIPTNFDWGSFNTGGLTTYGVYDENDNTILETGDHVQLIWAGPDGEIDPPLANGSPGNDDQLLDTSSIENQGTLPPPMHNKGYISLNTYSFDSEDSQAGGVVYIRAWNANTINGATAYGDSSTSILTSGGSFNATRWNTNQAASDNYEIFLPTIIK